MQGHFMGQVLVHGQHGWAGSQVPQPLTNVVTGPEGTMPTSSGSGSAEDTTYHPPLSQPQQPQTSLATPGTGASLPLVALATPKHCTEAHCSAPEELSQPSTGCIKYTGLFQAACSQMTARRLGIFRDTSLFINALIIMYEWSHVHECIDEQAHVTKKPKAAARAWNHPNKTLFALIITQKAERHTAFGVHQCAIQQRVHISLPHLYPTYGQLLSLTWQIRVHVPRVLCKRYIEDSKNMLLCGLDVAVHHRVSKAYTINLLRFQYARLSKKPGQNGYCVHLLTLQDAQHMFYNVKGKKQPK
ncbi:hypothetical protein WJX79_008136 [Trebouxia sp. C0005]